jgi:hypothetical protein
MSTTGMMVMNCHKVQRKQKSFLLLLGWIAVLLLGAIPPSRAIDFMTDDLSDSAGDEDSTTDSFGSDVTSDGSSEASSSSWIQPSTETGIVDPRWKSTKLTKAEKIALGIVPPPGFDFPDDDPTSQSDTAAAATTEAPEGDSDKNNNNNNDPKDESYYFPQQDDEVLKVYGDLSIVDTTQEEKEEEEIMAEEHEKVVPTNSTLAKTSTTATTSSSAATTASTLPTYNRRKFISYTPSPWEDGWTSGIENLVNSRMICRTLLHGKHQTARMHDFMDMICMARAEPPNENWCYYHDHNHYLWYDSQERNMFKVYIDTTPLELDGIAIPQLTPLYIDQNANWESIASKFTFLDEASGETYEEYIEPLVAQLRFPLTECIDNKPLLADFASYVIPPPNLDRVEGRTIMYDIGSRDWSRMEYVVEEWASHGMNFTYIITYAPNGNEQDDAFLTTIPDKHASRVVRHYLELTDEPTFDDSKVFLPTTIRDETHPDDYVVLKLDRTNAHSKESIVQYILDHDPTQHNLSRSPLHVDEILWEINASGNYVLESWFDENLQFDEISSLTLIEAYQKLLALRNMGIRAHSWI